MHALYSTIYAWVESSKYVLLFLGAFFEGPVVMMGAGFLYRLNQLTFWRLYLALVFGDFAADLTWYAVGRYGAGTIVYKYGHFFNVTPEIVGKVEKRFKTYQNSILIISKLTMGFGFSLATLVTAGLLKVPFKKFVTINLIGGFIWVLIMVGVGFFFGNVYYVVSNPFKIVFVIALIVVVILVIRTVNRFLVNAKI